MKRHLLFSFVLLWIFSGSLFAEADSERLRIKINSAGGTVYGYLNSSATAHYLAENLPITLSMRNLYSREMVYRFPDSLPTDNVNYTGYEVGEIIYWSPGNALVIMYAQNGEQFSMQKVGVIESDLSFFKNFGTTDVTIEKKEPNATGNDTIIRISVTANSASTIFELNNSQAAKDLYNQLPLSIKVENYSNNEKIFYLPEKLNIGNTPQTTHNAGSLAYYAPWGDVVMFYGSFGSATGLYTLGKAISGSEYIERMSDTIRIEKE